MGSSSEGNNSMRDALEDLVSSRLPLETKNLVSVEKQSITTTGKKRQNDDFKTLEFNLNHKPECPLHELEAYEAQEAQWNKQQNMQNMQL